MSKKQKLFMGAVLLAVLLAAVGHFLFTSNIAVLQPAGVVGQKEKHLMILAILLCMIVVLPVFTMTIFIAWKYREGNHKAKYSPGWDHSRLFETVWWAIPFIIIGILSVVAWNSSHDLDPFKALAAPGVKPLDIQVISLDWKWLFIYPEQHVASVNRVEIPVNTPVNFELTSDSVMNSFWVPALGGQIYTMPGMSTQLHLMADKLGSFNGSSANISGNGFSGMTFTAVSATGEDFGRWIESARNSGKSLDAAAYNRLAEPSYDNRVDFYSSPEPNLFNNVVTKYMMPGLPGSMPSSNTMYGMPGMAGM
jgi:cytochrome o ubiquinol oxidase subunit 2